MGVKGSRVSSQPPALLPVLCSKDFFESYVSSLTQATTNHDKKLLFFLKSLTFQRKTQPAIENKRILKLLMLNISYFYEYIHENLKITQTETMRSNIRYLNFDFRGNSYNASETKQFPRTEACQSRLLFHKRTGQAFS